MTAAQTVAISPSMSSTTAITECSSTSLVPRKGDLSNFLFKVHDDIWRLVFSALYEDAALTAEETRDFEGPPRIVEKLRLVCRYWCGIIDATPDLWRYVAVNAIAPNRKTSAVELGTVLKRSGTLGLRMSVFIDSLYKSHCDPYFATVTPHTDRLTEFVVKTDGMHCLLARHPMQLLPSDLRVPLTGLRFTTLRRLQLENIFLSSFDLLLIFLMRSPALEVLVIKNFGFPEAPLKVPTETESSTRPAAPLRPAQSISLPSLREMETDVRWIFALSSHVLDTPALKSVTFTSFGVQLMPREVYDHFSFMSNVEYLTLKGWYSEGGMALLIVGLIPRVRELRLHYCQGVGTFVDLMAAPPQNFPDAFDFLGIDFDRDHLNFSPSAPSVALQYLEFLEVIGGELDDASMLAFLEDRDALKTEGSKTVMVDISGCSGTTPKLRREIMRLNRGTWAREPKLPDTVPFPTPDWYASLSTCREHMGFVRTYGPMRIFGPRSENGL